METKAAAGEGYSVACDQLGSATHTVDAEIYKAYPYQGTFYAGVFRKTFDYGLARWAFSDHPDKTLAQAGAFTNQFRYDLQAMVRVRPSEPGCSVLRMEDNIRTS